MNHDAAQADAEIEVIVFGKLRAEAVEALAHGGGRHVGFKEGRQSGRRRQPLAQRHILPAGHGGRADKTHGFDAERAGQGQADPENPTSSPQSGQFNDHRSDQVEGMVGRRIRGFAIRALDHVAA